MGRLPLFVDGGSIRSPADFRLARRLARDFTAEKLESLAKSATEEYWKADGRAGWKYGPLGLLSSLAVYAGIIALVIVSGIRLPDDKQVSAILCVGFIIGCGYVMIAVGSFFDGFRHSATRNKLVFAHSVQVAVELKKFSALSWPPQ